MTYSVIIPQIVFKGQTVLIKFDGIDASDEYHFIYTPPSGSWDLTPAYTSEGNALLQIASTGWYSIGAQSRDATTQGQLDNRYVGQFYSYDPVQAAALLDDHASRLNYKAYDSNISLQASGTDWRAGIDSWQEFAQYVDAQYQSTTQSTDFTPEQAQVFFYLQWVSGLWSYGNPTQLLATGAVVDNEINGVTDPADVTVRTFLDSPIGCCTDYTTVMSYLLLEAGIESRVVSGNAHVFNEALIDGEWWTIDANLGLAYEGAWDQVISTDQTINVFQFDHAGKMQGSSVYRDSLVDFFNTFTQDVAVGQFTDGYRRDPVTFYQSLAYGHTFLDETGLVQWSGTGTKWSGSVTAPKGWTIGDFDGDGKTDALRATSGSLGAEVFLSDGSQLTAGAVWSTTVNAGSKGWIVGDFNGDGRDDLLSYQSGTSAAYVYLSTGSGFSAGSSWTAENDGSLGWSVGDFNGDGLTDILRTVNGVTGAEVFLSNSSSFVSAGSWTVAGSGSQNWYVGDFNGDGLDDLAAYTAGVGTTVFLSTGSSFQYAGLWTSAGQGTAGQWYVGDFNGDGLDDLGRQVDGIGFEYLASIGTGFTDPVLLASDTNAGDHTLSIGDFSGDGQSDVFSVYSPYNSGALEPIATSADLNGYTLDQFNLLVSFTAARLDLSYVQSPADIEASLQTWRPASVDTLIELERAISSAYTAASSAGYLASFSSSVAQVLFFAQWIGSMWRTGDSIGSSTAETVASNSVDGTTLPADVAARTYIAASIGSQADAATLLAAMLTHDGLENTVVTAGQYTINEVYVDGSWWSIDASLGIAFNARWDQVIDTAVSPTGYVFDVSSMQADSSTYSAAAAQLQQNFVMKAGVGLLYDFTRVEGSDWLSSRPDSNIFAAFDNLALSSVEPTAWSLPTHSGLTWYTGDFNGDG
ncbi:hypothetical protein WN73_33795, partial [Bradyrhizobium sp. CCBAU 45394]|uniref:FG-GAP-like repeat-containing protein n=1 Tax=Bradyrhizobium sp. CCBAU 45394 TaxID=1325087 RepID=UPI0023034D55